MNFWSLNCRLNSHREGEEGEGIDGDANANSWLRPWLFRLQHGYSLSAVRSHSCRWT